MKKFSKKWIFTPVFHFFIYTSLIIYIYSSTLSYLFSQWKTEDFNFCYLIPIIVAYLLWDKKESFLKVASQSGWIGIVPFLASICLYWLGELGGEYYTLYLSLWLLIIGILWLHFGWPSIRVLSFPLFISLFMFPFPYFIQNKFSLYLKLISSQIGVVMLQKFGLPAYREGNVIDLGFVELQVVDACSGLRYLLPLIILSLLIAYFSKLSFWKRIFLVISSIPLAIFTNSLRIALTGVIYHHWGAEVAEGFFHGFSGWLIFSFCFLFLMFEVWLLNKISFTVSSGKEKLEAVNIPSDSKISVEKHLVFTDKNRFFSVRFFLISLFLILTIIFSSGIEFREIIPIKKPFADFPISVGNWTGIRQTMDGAVLDELDLSDYIIFDYHSKNNETINFYVAYYESQRKGESIHSPETCIPGNGWIFSNKGLKSIRYAPESGKKMTLNTAIIQKNNQKQLVFYWFQQRGRILTNAFQLKYYNFWDALTKHRTDGALVRLITPIKSGESIEDAELRLQSFCHQLMPILNEFLPS